MIEKKQLSCYKIIESEYNIASKQIVKLTPILQTEGCVTRSFVFKKLNLQILIFNEIII
jgi:hypothetical protein